jgi:thiamine pyrophosphate-dependent acetolactate synthase large subunit-like protein
MQAVKQIVKPNEKGQVVIDLPADFQAEEVEVIILAMKQKTPEQLEKERLEEMQLLLNGPVATDEDIEFIEEKRRHFNSWK